MAFLEQFVSMDELPNSDMTCGPVSVYNALLALTDPATGKNGFDVCRYFRSTPNLAKSTSVKLARQTFEMASRMNLKIEVDGIVQYGTEAHSIAEYLRQGITPKRSFEKKDLLNSPDEVRILFIYWQDRSTQKSSGHAVLLLDYDESTNRMTLLDPNAPNLPMIAKFKETGLLNSEPSMVFQYDGSVRPADKDTFIPYGILKLKKKTLLSALKRLGTRLYLYP